MPRIWVLSDLHQEFTRSDDRRIAWEQKFLVPDNAPADVDVVVLAGDVDVPATTSLSWAAQHFAGYEIIYVCGNHDFYQFENEAEEGVRPFRTHPEVLADARERAAHLGIHLLENDSIEIAGVRFVGATLWTDYASIGDRAIAYKLQQARGRNGMNDYRRIKRPSQKDPAKRRNLRPIDTIAMHQQSRRYIEQTLANPFPGPTVVVSHHAPHPKSLTFDGAGPFDSLEHCYASNLTSILQSETAPNLWIHGHIHRFSDYRIGRTRVLANPMGYSFSSRRSDGFDPRFVVDV